MQWLQNNNTCPLTRQPIEWVREVPQNVVQNQTEANDDDLGDNLWPNPQPQQQQQQPQQPPPLIDDDDDDESSESSEEEEEEEERILVDEGTVIGPRTREEFNDYFDINWEADDAWRNAQPAYQQQQQQQQQQPQQLSLYEQMRQDDMMDIEDSDDDMMDIDYELMNENQNQVNMQPPFAGNNPFHNYHLQQQPQGIFNNPFQQQPQGIFNNPFQQQPQGIFNNPFQQQQQGIFNNPFQQQEEDSDDMMDIDYELMNENRNQANRQRPFGGNNPFQRGGVDLVHYFYHIFVDGIEARDDWDRNNDRKDEAKIEKFFRDNESRRRYYVDLSDLTTGYIVLSFKSGEPSKIPENIRINSKINLRRRSRIP